MKILYCRVGWMNSYQGAATEKPQGGGEYNKENIGHEVHNYLGFNGKYYGFVEAGVNNTIHVERLCNDKKADYADDILIIWVARKPSGGQVIVGWYENSRVYRALQTVPAEVMEERTLKTHHSYNIYSEHVFLIEPQKRTFSIEGMGHSNIWYGNDEVDEKVSEYVTQYDSEYKNRIISIENEKNLIGEEKAAIVKIRINQDQFRKGLLKKYNNKCCLCGVDNQTLLLASHIKPWAKSDEHEKLDLNNGLLLCPNHDRLFDKGYISFDESGSILISESLSENSKIFMNIHDNMKIDISADNREYIRYHRENIFDKEDAKI